MDSNIIQLCLLAATAIGAIATAIGIWISHRDQVKNQRVEVFATYTKRYQEILILQQEAINKFGEDSNNPEIRLAFRLYFDLCSEENYLHDHGYIYTDLWENWFDGMQQDSDNELCQKMWELHKDCYNDPHPFKDFYD